MTAVVTVTGAAKHSGCPPVVFDVRRRSAVIDRRHKLRAASAHDCGVGILPTSNWLEAMPQTCALLTFPRPSLISALSMELKLYSREWCSWCMDAKEYLSERGYSFVEIDVGEDRRAYEEMKELSNQTYVPTFVAGDKVLANFDTETLEKFLLEHDIHP